MLTAIAYTVYFTFTIRTKFCSVSSIESYHEDDESYTVVN